MSFKEIVLLSLICACMPATGGAFSQEVAADVAAADRAPDAEVINQQANPFPTAADARQGQQNFRAFCSRCHGYDARGAKGPDLTDGDFRFVTNDRDIVRVVSDGIPGTGMPGIGAGFDEFIWPIVTYLRSEEKARAAKPKPVPGDIAAGKKLFAKHRCATCHWVEGDGGRLGVDFGRLSGTREYVKESLLNPDAQIDGTHEPLQIEINGKILTGRRLDENTHYLLLMDEQEVLRSIPKSQIDDLHRPHKSLMPSFAKELTDEDVNDLAAYVLSIRKDKTQ